MARRKLPALLALLPLACASGAPPGQHRAPPAPAAFAGSALSSPSFASTGSPPVLAAAMAYQRTAQAVEPPIALTASDGTGLRLVSLDARAVVEGPLAFTELHLEFENPLDRQLEGRFSITLPDDAAISRLAMLIDTGWQEAEVVERMAARRANEDNLHRRQDPALLEKQAGNQFSARIFPIAARGRKQIKIAYSQQLRSSEEPYRLPLVGWPELERLEVSVRRGAEVSRVSETRFTPDRDVTVSQANDIAGLRNGRLALARIAPRVDAQAAPIGSALVLIDTSASRALGFAAYVERVGSLVQALRARHGDGFALRVACFDQGIERIYDGPASGFDQTALDAILARRPLGASNLHGALEWAAQQGATGRVILVSDGIATAGVTEGDALRDAVRALAPRTERFDVVLTGGIRDEAMMSRLARGTLARDGVVLDGSQPASELARRLSQTTISGVGVAIAGAEWVWPETLDGVQPGDEVLIYAALPRAADAVTVELSGPIEQTHAVGLTEVARPLLERAAAMAQISLLEHHGDPALRERIVELSIAHRVLSDHTALLVLETEEDYARFGIDRAALTDILVIGDRGVELRHRRTLVLPAPSAAGDDAGGEHKNGGVKDAAKQAEHKEGGKADEPSPGVDDTLAVRNGADQRGDRGVEREADEQVAGLTASTAPSGAGVARDPVAPPAPPPADLPSPATPDAVVVRGRVARPAISGEALDGAEHTIAVDRAPEQPQPAAPYAGPFAEVMELLARGDVEAALVRALRWRAEDPGDVMALIALGEALEASGNAALAARAYGSLIDLYPSRADMRRFAGERLERLGEHAASLALDTYAKALAQRPDHPSSHRLIAYALARAGKHAEAFAALDAALSRDYPGGRFAGVDRVLRDDLALIGAAWQRAAPGQRGHIERALARYGAAPATRASTRFVLSWETDANDVDLHVYDARGGHASYQAKQLASGGELYADVTTGYGPEAFVIDGAPTAGPYKLQAHYYSRGPMGYGMGTLDVIVHDGAGGLRFEHHPFVVMNDSAYVDLAVVK